jgi:hypothetical protein
MAKKLKLNEIAAHRKELGLNQHAFWSPLGVTQSGGSRYEGGRNIARPTALLLLLREQGLITNAHLESAAKEVAKQQAAAREARAVATAAKKDTKKSKRTR